MEEWTYLFWKLTIAPVEAINFQIIELEESIEKYTFCSFGSIANHIFIGLVAEIVVDHAIE